MQFDTIVVGGGAAGFFAAIQSAIRFPKASVAILEKTGVLLAKVKISGGGRCNVTHACFDPKALITYYPRGGKALLGPFQNFQPRNTIEWFEARNVPLKIEKDGRVFPVSDSSQSIVDCLIGEAKKHHIPIHTHSHVTQINKKDGYFNLLLQNGSYFECKKLILATGSHPKVYEIIKSLGHTIIEPVPSLFTFSIENSEICKLSGVSHPHISVKIKGTSLEQTGPILITHVGLSGPVILKLSAFGARTFYEKNYKVELQINWTEGFLEEEVKGLLFTMRDSHSKRSLGNEPLFKIPKSLWRFLVTAIGLQENVQWGMLSNKQLYLLLDKLRRDVYLTTGKNTHKEEFVTAGGVFLDEVDFKTMQSKICSGLYFAGELLDIDGVTGGFNFQNAWTTAWIASNNLFIAFLCIMLYYAQAWGWDFL